MESYGQKDAELCEDINQVEGGFMKSLLFLAGVLILLFLIGIGCAAQKGPGAGVVQKNPLPENPAEMEKPPYDKNRPLETHDTPKPSRGPMKAYEPGQVLVMFKQNVDEAEIGNILARYKLFKMKALPLPGLYQVKILSNDSVEKVIETLFKEAAVEYVEPNFIMQTQ